MLKYREINCKSALNKIDNEYGFCYDLNIYRGCLHKCYYCFAVYSHKYINSKDFFGEIFVKKNIAEVLEKNFLQGIGIEILSILEALLTIIRKLKKIISL